MTAVFIAVSAYERDLVSAQGYEALIQWIALSNANGVEIRRELLPEGNLQLHMIRSEIERYGIDSTYSTPVELWREDGSLNKPKLVEALQEAKELGARIIKVTLGAYLPGVSPLAELKSLLLQMQWDGPPCEFTVENDQNPYSGHVCPIKRFFEECSAAAVPIGMTFDIGNWHWVGQSPLEAAVKLAKYTRYIHCKQVDRKEGGHPRTVSLTQESKAEWRDVLSMFSHELPRCIEFPLQGADVRQVTSHYVQLLGSA